MSKNKRVKLIICVSVLLILSTVIGAFSAYSYKESKAFTETTTVPTTADEPENKATAKTTEALLLQESTTEEIITEETITEEIITEPKKVSESTVDDSEKCIMKIVVTKKPDKTVYYVGDELDFTGMTVTGYFSNGAVEDITKDVRIYNKVATCVMNNFDVYMEYNDNSEGIGLAFTKLYIKVLAPTLELSENNLSLGVGECKKLSAITEATGCTLTWHTTDSNVVQVDSDGNVTAVGAGSASIYSKLSCYTFELKSDNCQVTVDVPTVETEPGIVTE